MADYYLLRNDEVALVEESVYGTSAADPVAGDFFKHESSRVELKREADVGIRDSERDYGQASVLEQQVRRRKSTFSIKGKLIPSGDDTTPTAPDMGLLYKHTFGSVHTCTAHTTTQAGSTGTTLKLTGGGGAASGIQAGDLIAVDVDATYGIEVRRVISISTDDVVMDRALSTDPATGRAVYVGTTYSLSESALLSFHAWFFNGNTNRWKVPGCITNDFSLDLGFSGDGLHGTVNFGCQGQPRATQSVSKATATTAGTWKTPSEGKVFIDGTIYRIINGKLSVKNGYALRDNESDALYPTGMKRTDNNSRYAVEQEFELYLTSDTSSLDSGADTYTALDVIAQIGITPGKIVAWNTPNWRPGGENTEQDGEIGLKLAGQCFGTSGDDEVKLAFI